MSKLYCQALLDNRTHLEDEVRFRLRASGALHSQQLDEEVLRDRVAKLVDAFLQSLKRGPKVFVSYIETITIERIDEGIVLHELQLALQVLEERTWQIVVESIPLPDQVPCLGQVTLIIGTAKDRIADLYLQHLESIGWTSEFARHREGRPLSGVETELLPEDDLNWQTGTPWPHCSFV